MNTRAAVLREMGKDWEIIDLDLDPPKDGEVLIRFVAAGLCHSDDHLRTGDIPVRYPIVGGHEGAGIVEEVGAGVNRLKPGDHVVCSFLPTCGHCRVCASGMTNLCDLGALFIDNCLPDGTFRFHSGGEDFGQMCLLGTFSQRSVVSEHSCIKIDDDLPLETVALVGCGVPTGWGTAVNAGGVRPGDTTVIYGIAVSASTPSRARRSPARATSSRSTRWSSSGRTPWSSVPRTPRPTQRPRRRSSPR